MKVLNFSEFHLAPSFWSKMFTECDLKLQKQQQKSVGHLEKTFCLFLDYLYLIFLHLLSNQNRFKYIQLYSADPGFCSRGR